MSSKEAERRAEDALTEEMGGGLKGRRVDRGDRR
jgi:hypothetical protein